MCQVRAAYATVCIFTHSHCIFQGCSLNLHAPSSSVKDHFYSRPTAPGLIIATGNVGLTLNTEQSAANTYFSRDAGTSEGRTWQCSTNARRSHVVAPVYRQSPGRLLELRLANSDGRRLHYRRSCAVCAPVPVTYAILTDTDSRSIKVHNSHLARWLVSVTALFSVHVLIPARQHDEPCT
jgi:hypothetical protein